MKKQILYLGLLFIISVILSTPVFGDTLTVKQDGTGDYLKIQDAIDNAQNGSVVLVYPGVYYENVTFLGKTITLGSLYLMYQADSLINQTIIDGNHTGSCVRLENLEQNCRLVGFTLQNGSGTTKEVLTDQYSNFGGGIWLYYSSLSVENCIIKENEAYHGGGIYSIRSDLFLKGNRIYNNSAHYVGGGIGFASSTDNISHLIFDEQELNSLYLNTAANGYDLYKNDTAYCSKIILDTGTIEIPNHYYLMSANNGYPVNDLDIEVHHWKIERSESDLYVSPEGNNQNSGLTPEEPLKNIAYALLKIKADSAVTRTIHLAAGIYSPSLTGEKLALGLKSNVYLKGAGREKTIIDAENTSHFAELVRGEYGTKISNLSFINGNGYNFSAITAGIDATDIHKLILDSLWFDNCITDHQPCLFSQYVDTTYIHACIFTNNKGVYPVGIFSGQDKISIYAEIISCILSNNTFDTTHVFYESDLCIPLIVYGGPPYPDKAIIYGNIINCQITNNRDSAVGTLPVALGVTTSGNIKLNLVNCTIGNNTTYDENGAGVGVSRDANVNIYNSIIYGNENYQAYLTDVPEDEADSLYIFSSCIQDGVSGIIDFGQYNYLYYDNQTNISDDPEWFGQGDYPYMIGSGSPCIDAGTLDLPEGVTLPEYDLAGNPRIYGVSVDMGAYEWSPVSIGEYQANQKQKEKLLEAAPNPFNWETTITAKYEHQGKVKVVIYNNYGQLVKTLVDIQTTSGRSEMQWTGNDDNGNLLPKGIYHAVMYFDDKEVETLRLVKL